MFKFFLKTFNSHLKMIKNHKKQMKSWWRLKECFTDKLNSAKILWIKLQKVHKQTLYNKLKCTLNYCKNRNNDFWNSLRDKIK